MSVVSFSLYAQNGSNSIYSSDTEAITLLEKPASRKIVGGTIINVKYEGSNISSTMKGAFEHSCRLWEENIPTTYPINITVRFANISNTKCLATIETAHSGDNDYFDKVYAKRYAQLPMGGLHELSTLDFFRDTRDALITFSVRQPFDYILDGKNVNPNKYDFVTVAIQAIGRALGFTLNAYVSGNTLNRLPLYNKYTGCLISHQDNPNEDYLNATSGDVYIKYNKSNEKWYLHCPSSYDARYTLNAFRKDPENNETLFMQPDVISKGSAVRYIGEGMQAFFSYCGWDRPIATGMSSTLYTDGSTDDIIPYQTITKSKTTRDFVKKVEQDETIETYLFDRQEEGTQGNYVLLKNGKWEKYENLSDLNENEEYARTSDGFLRLKHIAYSYGPGGPSGGYANLNIAYKLYDYIPQRPQASMNGFKQSEYTLSTINNSRRVGAAKANTEYFDVEIGFQNVEGCTEVKVEQTDEDYPVPFFYYVDPAIGYFTAFMCKDYTSTFKLTYINKNGETIGEPFVIDLRNVILNDKIDDLKFRLDNDILHYELNLSDAEIQAMEYECAYTITSLSNTTIQKNGHILGNSGNIDISVLPKGTYVLTICYADKSYKNKFVKR